MNRPIPSSLFNPVVENASEINDSDSESQDQVAHFLLSHSDRYAEYAATLSAAKELNLASEDVRIRFTCTLDSAQGLISFDEGISYSELLTVADISLLEPRRTEQLIELIARAEAWASRGLSDLSLNECQESDHRSFLDRSAIWFEKHEARFNTQKDELIATGELSLEIGAYRHTYALDSEGIGLNISRLDGSFAKERIFWKRLNSPATTDEFREYIIKHFFAEAECAYSESVDN